MIHTLFVCAYLALPLHGGACISVDSPGVYMIRERMGRVSALVIEDYDADVRVVQLVSSPSVKCHHSTAVTPAFYEGDKISDVSVGQPGLGYILDLHKLNLCVEVSNS